MKPRILTTTIAALLLTSSLHAAERFWLSTSGTAVFNNTGNWSTTSGGASGASVPGAADSANFDLAGTYTVDFVGLSPTNVTLEIEAGAVTFDLSGVTYTLANTIRIGVVSGTATTARLTLFDGTLDVDTGTDNLEIGAEDVDGFLTVSTDAVVGAGGTNPEIFIGNSGDGTLTINNGGVVNSTSAQFGVNSSLSSGTAVVTGLGSQWNNAGSFLVGNAGSGTLTVQNGATISGNTSIIGADGGSIGTATVTGAGSLWTETGSFVVGQFGIGALTISSGGAVSVASTASIAVQAGSFGTVSVTGANSRWTTGTLLVGQIGHGSLTLSSGGQATCNALVVGDVSSASTEGTVTITGSGSTLTANGTVDIGDEDSGSLTVSNGGALVTATGLDIGNTATGIGDVTVTGAGAVWTNTGTINVANLGTGTLTVSNGGAITTGVLNVNDPAGAPIGTFIFDGGTITTNNFFRAAGGVFNWTDGTLRVINGSFNNSGAALTINGADAGDLPTLQMAGNSATTGLNTTTLTVGNNRAGALELTSSASVTVQNLLIGVLDGGDGAVSVSGNESILTVTSSIGVGGSQFITGGAGALNISAGGLVSTSDLVIWGGGTVTLDGGTLEAFSFDNQGGAFQFDAGTVHFTGAIYSGAFGSDYDALLGFDHRLAAGRTIAYDGSFSFTGMNLVVDGGTLSTVTGLTVGSGSLLEVRAGNVAAATLSNNAAGQIVLAGGSVALTTIFTNPGDLRLAATTDFSLITGTALTNTGLIHGNGQIGMALTNNSAGLVRAAAGERMVFTGAATNNGTGRFEVSAGGDLQFNSTLANNSTIDVIGGTLRVEGAATNAVTTGFITARVAILRFNGGLTNNGRLGLSFGTSDVFGAITNSATGRIIVSGNSEATFYGNVVNNGIVQVSTGSTAVYFGDVSGTGSYAGGGTNFYEGSFSPGASPALVTFDGDLAFGSAATLTLEIGGVIAGEEYDQLAVAGTLHAGGLLTLALLDGFLPSFGDTFDLLDVGTFAGDFDSISAPALGGGNAWDFSALKTTGSVTVVPEPGVATLLLASLGLLGFRRRE